ncbi:MAG: MotA/TolQ/ExbB proton channel family protein [Janthinobacterium lividum]
MLLSLFQNAGIVRYPLLICSILSVAIILERFWTLAMLRKLEDDTFEHLKAALASGRAEAFSSLEFAAAPVVQILNSISPLRGESEDTIGTAADISLALQRMRLRRFLGTLATIGSTTPFVGLFGTVLGIMSAFQGMSKSGLNGDAMAGGIAEALSATAFGLLVAVPSIVVYNYLVGRIQMMLLHIQSHVALLGPLYMRVQTRQEVA